jgi:hypothetical protein
MVWAVLTAATAYMCMEMMGSEQVAGEVVTGVPQSGFAWEMCWIVVRMTAKDGDDSVWV